MNICVAQTRPTKGDIGANISAHKNLIESAANQGAEMIVFPELSLTGYEPELASLLATDQNDPRFDEFQLLSDTRQIAIGVGVPTTNEALPCISLILFQPSQRRQTYSKQYLHADEEPYFSRGENHDGIINGQPKISFAICYELLVAAHAESAAKQGANIYIASVAKTAEGVSKTGERLAEVAEKYSMTVLMANSVGPSGDGDCAGGSAIWNRSGSLLAQLDDAQEGVLMIDTDMESILR